MATHAISYGELLATPIEELRKDLVTQRALVAKMKLGIQMKKEKDSARFRRERKTLARMAAALAELGKKLPPPPPPAPVKPEKTLKAKPKARTIRASSKKS